MKGKNKGGNCKQVENFGNSFAVSVSEDHQGRGRSQGRIRQGSHVGKGG